MKSGHISAKRRARLLAYAPLFLWIGVIFYFSSGQGSFEETSRFIGPLLKFLFPDASPETLAQYHGLIRKTAHVVAYAVLALLAFHAFRTVRLWSLVLLAIVLLVAVLDEANQSFNAERTGSAADVMLDFAGGLSAVGVIWLIRRKSGGFSRSSFNA